VITRFRAPGGDGVAVARLEPQQIAGIYPGHGEDRVLVQLDDAPPLFRETLLTVEDRHFESHHGIAPSSIARAFLANLKAGRVVQGAVRSPSSWSRTFGCPANRPTGASSMKPSWPLLLEARYPKDDILEAYINEAYLGQSGSRAIHGFGLGSEFFSTNPSRTSSFTKPRCWSEWCAGQAITIPGAIPIAPKKAQPGASTARGARAY